MSDEHIDVDHVSHEAPEAVDSNVVAGAEVTPEKVEVKCAGCDTVYPFDIDNTVDGFVFDCGNCKARTAWQRAA